jgi:hypothetical protein
MRDRKLGRARPFAIIHGLNFTFFRRNSGQFGGVLAWVGAALMCSCATGPAPERVAARYAEALRDGKLDAAYELLDEGSRPDAATFRAQYATEAARHARAEAILASLQAMRATSGEVELVRQGDAWRVADPPPQAAPRQALERFVSSVEGGDFQAAYLLLAQSWRDRYTPQRLEKDFALEPQAKDRVARVRAALGGKVEVEVSREGARLPLGNGRAVQLVKEGGGYKIAALE